MVISMDRWIGKVAIVTGASSGIGACIAERLVENGVIVVGVARRSERIEERAKLLSDKKGKLHAFKADIGNEQDILNLFEWTTKNLGPVHILINSAGTSEFASLTEGKTEAFKSCLNINVLALCIATREAVKIMKTNQIDGHIIHINSLLGHTVYPVPNMNVYPASKFAVTALAETLRQELNHLSLKIKITSISPGLVETERTTLNPNLAPERKAFYKTLPSLKSEDLADAVVYALSTPPHVQVHELMLRPVGDSL